MSGRNGWEKNDWISDASVVKLARSLMGEIDLDPASSTEANTVIGAREFFDAETNGWDRPWKRPGMRPPRTFLNPPGGRIDLSSGCILPKELGNRAGVNAPAAWWHRAAQRWLAGEIESLFFYGFNAEVINQAQDPRLVAALEGCLWFKQILTPTMTVVLHPNRRFKNRYFEDFLLCTAASGTNASVCAWLPPHGQTRSETVYEFEDAVKVLGIGEMQVPASWVHH